MAESSLFCQYNWFILRHNITWNHPVCCVIVFFLAVFSTMKLIKVNVPWSHLSRKGSHTCMFHFQHESDSDGNRQYMCYHITLYNVQCQDNINIVYNNILLYKILINKIIIKITYVTTSLPILPDIVWFNNTVIIQCTVYSVHWQLDTV